MVYESGTKRESSDEKFTIDPLIHSTNLFASCIIPYSAIKITCELGEGTDNIFIISSCTQNVGAFGIVYKGKVFHSNLSGIEDVAIKTLKGD